MFGFLQRAEVEICLQNRWISNIEGGETHAEIIASVEGVRRKHNRNDLLTIHCVVYSLGLILLRDACQVMEKVGRGFLKHK